jgi:hypothetical protein
MTVSGLWGLLRERKLLREVRGAEEIRQLLEGTSVAVDVSLWAVEADRRSKTLASQSAVSLRSFDLKVSFWRALHYLRLGCFPICVTDGASP